MAAIGLGKKLGMHLINLFVITCIFKSAIALMDMEELKSIYYGLDILNEPVVINQKSPSGSVQVTSKYGQQYQCTFPDHSEAEKKKEEEEKVAVETGIVEMLKPMKSQDCLIKTKDWWTYEFCFGKSVRQYHLEDGSIKGNVIHLGFYDSDFDWNNETAKEERLKTTLASYHSQLYNQGDKCDLTGQPRRVEVRFMCEENSEDYLSRIEESETCVYTMMVVTSRVCRHPYLRPPIRRRAVPITCNPLLSETEYKDYMTELNVRKEAAMKYKEQQRQRKEADLKKRKFTMDQELEDALMNTAKEVLSEPKGSLFPEAGEDGKVSKEDFQKMFGSNEQLWLLYQKGLQMSQKSIEERNKRLKELKDLQTSTGTAGGTEENEDEDKEDDEVLSEFYDEIDDVKKRFKRTQKKLSSIKQKLMDDRSWEANIEKAIEEAEEELGVKLDRTLVAGLSNTLNKLVNKLQDTENELSSMDEEINGLKPGDKASIIRDGDGQGKLDAGKANPASSTTDGSGDKLREADDDDDEDDDEDGKEKKDEKPVKGDGFDKDHRDEWTIQKPQDSTATRQPGAAKLYDDKIKPPPRTSSDQDMNYSNRKLEVPSTFPLPKDPTQDADAPPAADVPDNNNPDAPPTSLPRHTEGEEDGRLEKPQGSGSLDDKQDADADAELKMSLEELEETDDGNKIPPNIKEMLEETVRKEYEKKIVRKSSGKLGLDDDHSFIQDKSIHVIQQEDKDGNTNKFIVVLGFKNMDEEVAEQDRQSSMEENYGFVYNKGNRGSSGSGGSSDDGGEDVTMMVQEGEGGEDNTIDQPVR